MKINNLFLVFAFLLVWSCTPIEDVPDESSNSTTPGELYSAPIKLEWKITNSSNSSCTVRVLSNIASEIDETLKVDGNTTISTVMNKTIHNDYREITIQVSGFNLNVHVEGTITFGSNVYTVSKVFTKSEQIYVNVKYKKAVISYY